MHSQDLSIKIRYRKRFDRIRRSMLVSAGSTTNTLKYFASDITSDMISEWLSRVGSSIPRGFSRQYILSLLRDQSMTGKEIIDKATLQSEGKWRPSPGLIYPLLGRLLDEGLVVENNEGRYAITKKGLEITSDLQTFGNMIQKQIDVMLRVGNVGRFVAMDLIDRIATIGSTLSSNLDSMTQEERNRYKEFLQSELNKLYEQEAKNAAKEKVNVE
ncbi:MAG: PadR family transcriptional regulator [Thermoproteota archaeon]|nr:PadR family transcriptional regulator [Thermoproteota archaeon]